MLNPAQIIQSGAVLGRAFFDDPMFLYIFQEEQERIRLMTWFMKLSTRLCLQNGEVDITESNIQGVAGWLSPKSTKISMWRMLKVGFWAAPFKMSLGAIRRFFNTVDSLERWQQADLHEPHRHLLVLGVDPPLQGQGIGSSLLDRGLKKADKDHLSCYLETANSQNVPFYQKHGFEVIREDKVAGGGCHFWTMWRSAR